MRTWICLILIFLPLIGCSAPEGSQRERFVPARPVTSIVANTVTGTVEGAWAAVQMPFEDLNFKRRLIPEKLQQIINNPYTLPPQMLCDGIRKEISELDALLGPDVCTPDNPTGVTVSRRGEYVEKGAVFARERAVGIVGSKANIIPFRGVVRKITGAEKHTKEVDRAYQAGKLRRAFLKGLAASLGPGCLNLPGQSPPLLEVDGK